MSLFYGFTQVVGVEEVGVVLFSFFLLHPPSIPQKARPGVSRKLSLQPLWIPQWEVVEVEAV
jgi:hypothetical protein